MSATLVTITGIDGAGKSTLAENVVDELRSEGYHAEYVYGRYLRKLTSPVIRLGNMTLLSDTDSTENYNDHMAAKQEMFSNSILAKTWEVAIMADYAPQILYRLLPSYFTAEFVICDRYFYDNLLTDLCKDVVTSPEEALRKANTYGKLLPTPDWEFYVHIPVEVAASRKDDVPSIEYLHDRKEYYDVFAAETGMTRLDGTQQPQELVTAVVSQLLEERR